MNSRKEGSRGEDLAAEYLAKNGYSILERNFRFERGEVDLIARDGDELVFIEVKARRSDAFGLPEDAITPQKEEQIKRVAEGYLFERQIENQACRFDVVAITYNQGKSDIRIIRNAF
ncbi:MAG: YraN family protein [Bacteroidota bacterium]